MHGYRAMVYQSTVGLDRVNICVQPLYHLNHYMSLFGQSPRRNLVSKLQIFSFIGIDINYFHWFNANLVLHLHI